MDMYSELEKCKVSDLPYVNRCMYGWKPGPVWELFETFPDFLDKYQAKKDCSCDRSDPEIATAVSRNANLTAPFDGMMSSRGRKELEEIYETFPARLSLWPEPATLGYLYAYLDCLGRDGRYAKNAEWFEVGPRTDERISTATKSAMAQARQRSGKEGFVKLMTTIARDFCECNPFVSSGCTILGSIEDPKGNFFQTCRVNTLIDYLRDDYEELVDNMENRQALREICHDLLFDFSPVEKEVVLDSLEVLGDKGSTEGTESSKITNIQKCITNLLKTSVLDTDMPQDSEVTSGPRWKQVSDAMYDNNEGV